MTRSRSSCPPRRGLNMAMGAVLSAGVALGQNIPADWKVEQATLRFTLQVENRPSDPSAGLLAELPDAGLLPKPFPFTQVFRADGTPVESYTLWHNPDEKLAVLIGDPGAGATLTVYVQPSARYRTWTPESGLTPGGILTTDSTRAAMDAARALATPGRVGPGVHHRVKNGVAKAPLSIAGDETGRPRPASFYMLTHVRSGDPGRTWIAPMSTGDRFEVRVNGTALNPRKRIDKWGGTGDWADIRPGPNRLEIFVAADGDKPFYSDGKDGVLYLTWRTPNATLQELGGARSDKVPMPGTSRMETRIIRDSELIRSGTCAIRGGAQLRDGRFVALPGVNEPKVYWFGKGTPLLGYRFEARTEDPDARNTTFTWTFPDGITLDGPAVEWILPGFREHRVRLTTARDRIPPVTAATTFYGYSARGASFQNEQDRAGFRQTLWTMVKAYPPGHEAVANWDPAFWNMLLATVEFGKGTPLLRDLFTRHADILAQCISTEQREALEDVFLDVLPRRDPEEAFNWIRTFAKTADGQRRKDELIIRAAEIHMHYRRDLESAEKLLRTLFRKELDDGQRFLRIRLGDLALLKGDLNLATRYYADVQNYTRIRRSLPQQATPARGQPTGRPIIGASMNLEDTEDWKLRALVDASASETVRSLLEQGHLLEARAMLRLWERDLPLSKISADFILLESKLYDAVRDSRRAASMLYAFCATVESSNYMPEAAPLLLNLMMDAGDDRERIRQMGKQLQKRLEFHPVAKHLERLITLIPEQRKPQDKGDEDDAL